VRSGSRWIRCKLARLFGGPQGKLEWVQKLGVPTRKWLLPQQLFHVAFSQRRWRFTPVWNYTGLSGDISQRTSKCHATYSVNFWENSSDRNGDRVPIELRRSGSWKPSVNIRSLYTVQISFTHRTNVPWAVRP
jgi:hypothetical protein